MAKWFDTEDAAAVARDEFERGERTVEKKREVWVVGDRFVVEACDGGVQIGEVRAIGHESIQRRGAVHTIGV